ncbi:pilus assembly protein [Escherichia coli]|nr:pilus assembly protein [Escherichia coli]
MNITNDPYMAIVMGIDFLGNDSNLLIVFYVQIMPDDFVMQLHRF